MQPTELTVRVTVESTYQDQFYFLLFTNCSMLCSPIISVASAMPEWISTACREKYCESTKALARYERQLNERQMWKLL